MEEAKTSNSLCENIPSLLSSFVDTFVDFSASGGLFLPPKPTISTPQKTIYTTPNRLIAIGDLHGDLYKSKQAFRLAGLIDLNDHWCGGDTTVVQVGDVLDRGGDEIKILYFLEKLKREAEKFGGVLITMNGNHEIMNVDGDFRYVTKMGLNEFRVWADWYCVGDVMKRLCNGIVEDDGRDLFDGVPLNFSGVRAEIVDGVRARVAALRPNGPIAKRFLTTNVTVLVIGDSVFVHGGLLPQHVGYGLERINEEVRDWIGGFKERVSSELVRGRNSLVWLRRFSDELAKNCDCSTLEHVLATIPGAKRMIMGHTIQEKGINGVCDNKAIRIDVGMSRGCTNGLPEVLEINGKSEVRILTSNTLYRNGYKSSIETDVMKGAMKMIMGHTIQENGINGVCDSKAIRIDNGISRGCTNGLPEVLEINGKFEVWILTSNTLHHNGYKSSIGTDVMKGIGFAIPQHGPKQVEVEAWMLKTQ